MKTVFSQLLPLKSYKIFFTLKNAEIQHNKAWKK